MRWLVAICSIAMTLLFSCDEVINLGAEGESSQLFVFGRLTSGLDGNIVQIAQTSVINNGQEPVVGAEVYVVTGDGRRERYLPIEEGVYRLRNAEIVGQPGQEYHVEITLADGSQYKSVPAIMPQKVAQDYVDFEPRRFEFTEALGQIVGRNYIDFKARTEIFNPEEDHYIRWVMLETFLHPEAEKVQLRPSDPPPDPPYRCFVTTELEPQKIVMHDGSVLKLDEIPRRTMIERRHDTTFAYSYHFHLVQLSLTADAHRYWTQIDQVANVQGSIFDEPLGPIRGNLFNVNNPDEQVLGYFEVSQVDTTRIQAHDEDIPFRVFHICAGNPGAPQCDDCLVLPGSTKEKPYWMD